MPNWLQKTSGRKSGKPRAMRIRVSLAKFEITTKSWCRNQLIVNAEMVMSGSDSNSALYRGDLLDNSATATIAAAMKTALTIFQKTPMLEFQGYGDDYFCFRPSRQAMTSSSPRTASSTGITGCTSNTNAGSIEQNL